MALNQSSSPIPELMVIGGASRLGKAIISKAEDNVLSISRQADGYKYSYQTTKYTDIPEQLFHGIKLAINCTGSVSGNPSDMHIANVVSPVAIAQKAKASGVRQFIHISSFAVYQQGQIIDDKALVSPKSDYGRTKLAGDQALLSIATPDFHVACVRLPALYDNGKSKLSKLIQLWNKIRYLPVPAGDIKRSMMHYDLAAICLMQMRSASHDGVFFAADPEPFTYEKAKNAISRIEPPKTVHLIKIPQPLFGLARIVAPNLINSLYADMLLSESNNMALKYRIKSRLYDDICKL
jgi:nucleoside-diphosphate-sugar epimerase